MFVTNSRQELQSLELHSAGHLRLLHQHASVQVEHRDVAVLRLLLLVLLALQRHDHVVLASRKELEITKTARRRQRRDASHLDLAKVLRRQQHRVGPATLVLVLVVRLLAHAPRQNHPLSARRRPRDCLMNHVARIGTARRLANLVETSRPILVRDHAVAVDHGHPHVVRVLDGAVGIGVLLAEAAHVHLAVLHRGPLRLLSLVRVAVALHENEARNGLVLHDLKNETCAVVEGVESSVVLDQGAQLHSSPGLADFGVQIHVLRPIHRIGTVAVSLELPLLHYAHPLPLLVVDHLALLVQIRDNGQVKNAVPDRVAAEVSRRYGTNH